MTRAPRESMLPWLVGALVVVLGTWPWVLHPTLVLGSPAIEADNHLFMLWRAVQSLWGNDGPWVGYPLGEWRPYMDVVHLPLAWLLMPLGLGFAYSALAAVDLGLAAAGGYWLSLEAGASKRGALVGMVSLGLAPFLGGQIVHGLTEDWPLGLFALYAAATLRLARTGERRMAVASALLLACAALSGWYFAFFAALMAPVVLLWAGVVHRPSARTWALIVGAGGLAVLLVLPFFVHFLGATDLDVLAERRTPGSWTYRDDWRYAWDWRADPVNLVLPHLGTSSVPRTVYLGVASLGLALVGARRQMGARVALLGVAWFAVWGLGPYITVAGRALFTEPLPGPAALLHALVPRLQGLAVWYRAVGLSAVFLAPAAALGASALLEGRALRWTVGLLALVGADALLLSDTPWPRPVYDPSPPAALLQLPGAGAVALLPFDRGQDRWSPHVPRLYQRWQPFIGRPITENYEGEAPMEAHPLMAWSHSVCDGPVIYGEPTDRPPRPDDINAQRADLLAQGVEVLAVVHSRVRDAVRCTDALTRALGPPTGRDAEISWWTVAP